MNLTITQDYQDSPDYTVRWDTAMSSYVHKTFSLCGNLSNVPLPGLRYPTQHHRQQCSW
jgi:hypothetical protein